MSLEEQKFLNVFVFLGLQPWHMEVPRLGLNRSSSCQSMPQPLQIRGASATHTRAYGNAGSLTHWARAGIEPMSSWVLVGFFAAEPQWELQEVLNSFGRAHSMRKFPGQGSIPHHSSNLSHSSDSDRSLTCCVTREFQKFLILMASNLSVFFFFVFCLFRGAPAAYGGSQTRGPIRAAAAGLHHSHRNSGSQPHLRPTPQLMAMPDP